MERAEAEQLDRKLSDETAQCVGSEAGRTKEDQCGDQENQERRSDMYSRSHLYLEYYYLPAAARTMPNTFHVVIFSVPMIIPTAAVMIGCVGCHAEPIAALASYSPTMKPN